MLTIGTIYRMSKPPQFEMAVVDDLPNFYYESGEGFEFQRGIHNVREVKQLDGKKRCPLIIISSTPRKAGSQDTPWQDRYDSDHGYVKYYGDNKSIDQRPEDARGNKVLLNLLKYYESEDSDERLEYGVPVVFFEKVSVEGRAKGNAVFHGFGILESVQLVTQYDANHNYFANYQFQFCILSLAEENEQFDWRWIKDRCDAEKGVEETMRYAPKSWKRWVEEGKESLHLIRRNVVTRNIVSKSEQKLDKPDESELLEKIYNYYTECQHKHEFEYLAMDVTVKTIEETGGKCLPGWITKKSGDGGVDFVLRVDIGKDRLASVKVGVLGQAKCEKINTPTNGIHIARTAARLKKGWIGAFVTTSYFSESVQKEVIEDGYPLLLINGKKIVELVERELFASRKTLEEYLDSLRSKYKREMRIPEEIME